MKNEIINFLDNSPNSFWATENIKNILINNGYEKLDKKVEKGKKYYITRNGSSIIAFNIGKTLSSPSIQFAASHTDCPSFKVKPNPIIKTPYGNKLNVEEYGGCLRRPWFDRPLSLSGRVTIKENGLIKNVLYKDNNPFCIIPSVAPHLNREIETNPLSLSVDICPLVSLDDDYDFYDYLKSVLKLNKGEILSYDLYLYPLEKAYIWGKNNEFITSSHIDNLECAYTSLLGFINNFNDENINIYASFDNEEVGSLTRQGADSDFLEDTLNKIADDLNLDKYQLYKKGMLVSCDNAHAIHPNHPELYDTNNAPMMNKGIVIKYNASQSYTTDSYSSALFKDLLNRQNIPFQVFANKTGSKGGSTLGNISLRHVSLVSIDIGLAQLAMHSPIETAGYNDIQYMIDALKTFWQTHLDINNE